MRNRPGRIYYLIDYKGIPEDFIVEYCTDNLEAKQHIPAIVRVSKMFNEFNFDMLKAMVEEMNRYNETPEQVLEMLNARPTTDSEGTYTITLNIDGKDVKSGYYPTETEGSPLQGPELVISYNVDDEDDEDGAVSEALESLASAPRTKRRNRRAGRHLFNVRQTCLHKFNAERGEFEYKLPDDVFVRFQRVRKSEAKYFDLLA
jgi:hypothetical protein